MEINNKIIGNLNKLKDTIFLSIFSLNSSINEKEQYNKEKKNKYFKRKKNNRYFT